MPRSGQKIARVSAQYKNRIANQRSVCNSERTSSAMDEACRLRRDEGYGACEDEAPLFAYFFWCSRKSRPPEAQLQCHCKIGTPVKPDKRADRVVRPYKLLCRITRGATAAVLPQKRHLRCQTEKERALARSLSGTHYISGEKTRSRVRPRRWCR